MIYDEIKIKEQHQTLNSKVEILPVPTKDVQIDLKNAEKMIDEYMSKRFTSFMSRINLLESNFTENQTRIANINNHLNSARINLNELKGEVSLIGTKINNVNDELVNGHERTYREIEKIIQFLQT